MNSLSINDFHTMPNDFPDLDVYAVVGNPIAHSKSPVIHQRFAEQAKQKMHYGRIQAELGDFAKVAKSFFAAGGMGLNITIPFKLDAQAFAEVLTPRARLAGAVNTLYRQNSQIFGDNTDGAGLVRDLLAQGLQLRGARILLLGAGGAARGAMGPLLEQSPKQLIIANRSSAKANDLAQLFGGLAKTNGVELASSTLNELEDPKKGHTPFELVINATAAGLSGESPLSAQAADNIFIPSSFAYEMVYGKSTAFMQQALQRGARVSDGLGMLVEQAADAFLIWRGAKLNLMIDPRSVLAKLRHSCD
jgi:shikimate dehydrogenase